MLLRRVIAHLRKQEWTAIGLDFLIVVIGVFIGIQVSNWNEARALRAQERTYLAQLHDELATNDRTLRFQVDYTETSVAAGERALAYLEGGRDCTSNCEALLIDVFHASQMWGTGYATDKFREADRLGFPANEQTQAPVRFFYEYISGWNTLTGTPPAFRERARGYLTPDASRALWSECFVNEDSMLEVLTRNCENALRALDARAMLRAMREDRELARHLRFWIGQNTLVLAQYPVARQAARNAMDAITSELERRPRSDLQGRAE